MKPAREKSNHPTDPSPKADQRIRISAWLWTAAAALCWFALSWESMGARTGFIGVAFMLASLVIATPLTLASITFFANKTRPELVRVFGPLAAGIWLGLGTFILISSKQESWSTQIAMERGDSLVQALNRFNEDTGTYPEQLSDLTPKYLPSVPFPYSSLFPGDEYSYTRHTDGFLLTFPTGLLDHYDRSAEIGWYLVPF